MQSEVLAIEYREIATFENIRPVEMVLIKLSNGLDMWMRYEGDSEGLTCDPSRDPCLYLFSHVQLFATLWTVACQVPLFMGFFQARILEWVAISFSRGSSQPRDQTCVSCVSCISRQICYCLNHQGT